jgi:hypothetical protein
VTLRPDPSLVAQGVGSYLVDESGRRAKWCRGLLSVVVTASLALFVGGFLAIVSRPNKAVPPSLPASVQAIEVTGANPLGAIALSEPASTPSACTSLSGVAFIDRDLNGARTPEEPGVANVAVVVFGPGDLPIESGATDADGDYNVQLEGPTVLRVEFSTPPGLYMWGPVGFDAGPSSAFPVGPNCTASVGLNGLGVFAGDTRYKVMQAAGRVFRDDDCDDANQAVESGIGGVDVALLDASGAPLASTTSDGQGWYSFTGLREGVRYRVRVGSGAALRSLVSSVGQAAPVPAAQDAKSIDVLERSRLGVDAIADVVLGTRGASTSAVHFGFAPAAACQAAEQASAAAATTTKPAKSRSKSQATSK